MLVSIYPESLLVVKMCLELQLRRKKTKFWFIKINNFSLEFTKPSSV